MKFDVFKYTCEDCSAVFEAPVFLGDYGILSARSLGQGSMVLVDTFSDEVFNEVHRLADETIDRSGMTDSEYSDLFQYVFSASIDVDSDGSDYRFGEHLRCPSCGSHRMRSWVRTGKLIELDVPSASHISWSAKTLDQKRQLIRDAIREFRYQV